MDWLKLSVDLPDHHKITGLSDRAFRALIASWCYSARFETDGHLPLSAAKKIGVNKRISGELESAGLLHQNGDGWHINDWSEHQIDPGEMRARREARRAQWRDSKARKRKEERDAGST